MNPDTPMPAPSGVVLPVVRQVTVCRAVDCDDETWEWTVTGPYSVAFLPTGMGFPFRADELAVYTQLVGGLGAIRLGVEIRQRTNTFESAEPTYREVGTSIASDEHRFFGDTNRLTVHEVGFRFAETPFEHEGTYEFRIVAEMAGKMVVLGGAVGEITILTAEWRASDA